MPTKNVSFYEMLEKMAFYRFFKIFFVVLQAMRKDIKE